MEQLFHFIAKQFLLLAIKAVFDVLIDKIKKCVSGNTHLKK